MTPDPCDERGAVLSKSAKRQDLRVSCNVLVEPAEITFVWSTVLDLFAFFFTWNVKFNDFQSLIKRIKGGCLVSLGHGRKRYYSHSISHACSTSPASWDLSHMGLCKLTTNYTLETEVNKLQSKLLTPRKCCWFPNNKQFPQPESNLIGWSPVLWKICVSVCYLFIDFLILIHHYSHIDHIFPQQEKKTIKMLQKGKLRKWTRNVGGCKTAGWMLIKLTKYWPFKTCHLSPSVTEAHDLERVFAQSQNIFFFL